VTLLRRLSPRVRGTLLCLAAAAGFGASPLLARAGEDAGVGVVALLGARFAIAAAILWVLVLRRGPLPSGRAASRGLALGLLVYAPEAGLYFAALTRMDAAPAAMLVALYPALVAVGAIALGRERMSRRLGLALLAALAGVALVLLGGGGVGSVDGLGVALALGSAVGYGVYVLASENALAGLGPLPLAALVCTGCALAFGGVDAATGGVPLALAGSGWLVAGALALLSTVMPIACLLAGIRSLGAAPASVISTAEPIVTAALAAAILGERMGPGQALGAALVVGAILVLQARGRASAPADELRGEALQAGPDGLAARADGRRGHPLRHPVLGRQRLHVLGLDRLDALDHLVDREQLRAGEEGLADPVHAGARALQAEHQPALEVVLGPAELVGRDGILGEPPELGGDHPARRREVVLAGAEVDADLTRVRVAHGV
jgi:drug/metabolite transporter (DMT)-like permease